MLENAFARPVIGLPLAAAVVLGLYAFMNRMISVDFTPPEEQEARIIELLKAPSREITEVRTRDKIKPLELADRPPPPAKLTAGPADIDIPVSVFPGGTPASIEVSSFGDLTYNTVIIDARDAKPISPPVPTYPAAMAAKGIEGDCDVHLNVDTRGRPFDVQADCTHAGFVREAERAVGRVQFAPMLRKGQAIERRNVIYPLAFRLES